MDREQLAARESGERQPAARGATGGGQLHEHVLLNLVQSYLPLILLLIGILVIIAPVWGPGYPWGSDSWGHLQRAAYVGQSIRTNGLFSGIAHAEWMPDWYMGDPMSVYYPPLTTLVLGPLTALFGDVFIAYRVLVTAIFVILGLSVYAVGSKWGNNRWLAAAGGLLSVAAPYTLHTIFAEGNLPRGLALLTLPWIIWDTELILKKRASHGVFVVLTVLWALAIVAHVMQAAIFAVAVGLYVLFRVIGQIYIPLRRALLALLPVAFGAGMAAAYLIPAYAHLELSGVPSLPGVKIALFSIDLSALLPYHPSIEAISVGIVTLLLALAVTFYHSNQHHRALFAVGLLCVVFAFGPSSGLFLLVPLNQSLLPERFLNVSAILFPLTIAALPYGYQRRKWILAAVALALLIDFVPAWRVVQMRQAPPDELALAKTLAQDGSLPGRVAPLTFPNPTAPEIYLTSEVGGHADISGWALENTPQQDMIRRLLSAVTRSPEYLNRVLSLWNTDYLVTRFEDSAQADGIRSLPFSQIAGAGDFELWQRTTPSAFVQQLPDNRMLVVGDNPTSWLFAFPFASEGTSADPSNYSADYLAHYSVIGLNRLPDNADIETALGDWVAQGNTLIVDLSGMGSAYDQGFTLFGVHTLPLALNGDYAVNWPAELASMPSTLPLHNPDGPWTGASYFGLDTVTASLTDQGQDYPLLGYRSVGKGRVWFVSLNLIYLLDTTGQQDATHTLVNYLLASTSVNQQLTLPAFHGTVLDRSANAITLRYDSTRAASVVVSMTYFPRWQALIDGQPLTIQNHEHLVLLNLPAGQHTVSLQYAPYTGPAFLLGWGMSLVFAMLTILTAVILRRRPVLSFEERSHTFDDRLPQVSGPVSTNFVYAPCPNCHFPFATQGPPNEQTYPFFSLECPVCGFELNHEGVLQGAPEQTARNDEMVREWLKKSDISEEQLNALFGINSIDELFK